VEPLSVSGHDLGDIVNCINDLRSVLVELPLRLGSGQGLNALLAPPRGFLKEGDFLTPNEHPASRHRLSSELGRRCRTELERG
jgi:hypothetical protein